MTHTRRLCVTEKLVVGADMVHQLKTPNAFLVATSLPMKLLAQTANVPTLSKLGILHILRGPGSRVRGRALRRRGQRQAHRRRGSRGWLRRS
jgi:hypothetical protein